MKILRYPFLHEWGTYKVTIFFLYWIWECRCLKSVNHWNKDTTFMYRMFRGGLKNSNLKMILWLKMNSQNFTHILNWWSILAPFYSPTPPFLLTTAFRQFFSASDWMSVIALYVIILDKVLYSTDWCVFYATKVFLIKWEILQRLVSTSNKMGAPNWTDLNYWVGNHSSRKWK